MSSLIYLFISCCYVIVITVITVITFDDEIRELPNPDEERRRLKEAAREVTGSEPRDVFMIANSIPNQEFDPAYKKEVLNMLEQALKCGERSVKMRQVEPCPALAMKSRVSSLLTYFHTSQRCGSVE